ncbi:UNVERIFIED_CONTAM: Nucleolar Complex 2 protein [Siphonaria sp. JEL0065]|nr:Nucleolar Complex 2 protein [Siphonaria sp. JEL0065]
MQKGKQPRLRKKGAFETWTVQGKPSSVFIIRSGSSSATAAIAIEPKKVFVVIPGNPGVLHYYAAFAEAVFANTANELDVVVFQHPGHNTLDHHTSLLASLSSSKKPLSLEQQIAHKLEMVDHLKSLYPPNTRFILSGHSIGSFMALRVLRERPSLVSKVVLLFPTIKHIANTRNGWLVSKLAYPGVRHVLAFVLMVLKPVLMVFPVVFYSIVALFTGMVGEPLKMTIEHLLHYTAGFHALTLGHHEMCEVLEADWETIEAHHDNLTNTQQHYNMGTKKATKKFMKNHLKDKVDKRRKFKKENKGRIERLAKEAKKIGKKTDESQKEEEEEEIVDHDVEMGFGGVDDDGLQGSDNDEDEIESLDGNVSDEAEEDDQEGEGEDDVGSDLDEEQVDEEADSPAAPAKKHLRSEIAEHKAQLEALKAKDPVFYDFLLKNDSDLLGFGGDDDDEEEEEEEPQAKDDLQRIMKGEIAPDQEEEDEEDATSGPIELTKKMLSTWKKALIEQHSLRSARKVVLAFRAVVSQGETENEESESQTYIAGNEKIANNATVLALKYVGGVLDHHLPVKVNKGKTPLPSSASKWKIVAPLVKSLLTNILRFLDQVSDEGMLRFVIRESEKLAVYFACVPKSSKDLLKKLLNYWTSTTAETRITAFLTIRRLAIACPSPYLENAIKGAYQTYSAASRTTNLHTWSSIGFMANCFVELIGLDVASGYRFGFVYLRTLANGLRNAITTKSKESFKQVYNWQYINALRLWTRVLTHFCEPGSTAESAGGKTLRPLLYPLTQIILGVARLKPSAKYLPLRFQCCRLLIDLCKKTKIFIPLASNLFELFDTAELRSHAKPSTLKPLNFVLTLKAPAQYLGTRTYQTGVVEEVVGLLMEYYDCFSLTIGFPELVVPAVVQFRRWIKRSKNVTANKQIQSLLESLEANAKFIESKRGSVDFAPKDEGKVNAFLNDVVETSVPLRRHAIARRKLREQQLAEMQKEADRTAPAVDVVNGKDMAKKKKAGGGKRGGDSDDDDEVGGGFDMDDDDDDDEEEDEDEEELEVEDEDEDEEEMEEDE